MGGRQAGHLLAAARPDLRLDPATYTVTVRLQDIVTHNGQPSYRKMADFYVNRQGAAKVLHFTFHTRPGGSVPAWNPG